MGCFPSLSLLLSVSCFPSLSLLFSHVHHLIALCGLLPIIVITVLTRPSPHCSLSVASHHCHYCSLTSVTPLLSVSCFPSLSLLSTHTSVTSLLSVGCFPSLSLLLSVSCFPSLSLLFSHVRHLIALCELLPIIVITVLTRPSPHCSLWVASHHCHYCSHTSITSLLSVSCFPSLSLLSTHTSVTSLLSVSCFPSLSLLFTNVRHLIALCQLLPIIVITVLTRPSPHCSLWVASHHCHYCSHTSITSLLSVSCFPSLSLLSTHTSITSLLSVSCFPSLSLLSTHTSVTSLLSVGCFPSLSLLLSVSCFPSLSLLFSHVRHPIALCELLPIIVITVH